MPRFFIAAGHGNTDPGAVSAFGIERDIAIAVVNEAARLCSLQNTNGREIVVVPHNLGLEDAIYWINARVIDSARDLCMEVHLNSNAGTPGTGIETYYGNKQLATEINEELVKVLGLSNRGVKEWNGLMFNNSTNVASCLTELGFVNNSGDVQAIVDRGGLALAKGIIRACGGTYKDPVIVTPPTSETPVVTPPVAAPVDTLMDKETNAVVKENNNLLKQILKIVTDLWNKLTSIFK